MRRLILAILLAGVFAISRAQGATLTIDGSGRTIHVLCLPSAPPFLIERKNGEPTGFLIDLFQAMAEAEGLKVSLRTGDWHDLLRSVNRGQVDVILGAPHPVPRDMEPFSHLRVYNVDPSEFTGKNPLYLSMQGMSGKDIGELCFSVPLVGEPYSYIVKKGGGVRTLRDLRERPLLAGEGDAGMAHIRASGLTSRAVGVKSMEDLLRLVSSGTYDGALLGTYQGLYLQRKLGIKDLEYLSPPAFTLVRGMVVTRGDVGLASRLGRAFETLRQNGTYRRLEKEWFGRYEAAIVDRDRVVKMGAVALAVFGLVVAWNVALKRKVARITKEREKILDFARDGIVAVDQDGRVSLINRVAQELLAVDGSVVGKAADEVIPDVDLTGVLESREAVYDVEQNLRGSLVIGNKVPIVFRGLLYGAIATFRDMTEIHTLAEEITGVRMYVESLRVQNHEFQNKLQAIAGLIQMGRYEKAIEFITDEAASGSSTTTFISESIKNPAVGGIVIGKVGRCRELGIEIAIDPDSYCGEAVSVSDQAMVVIIGNLLENAMEAALASGVEEPRIDFAIFDESNRIMVSVVDNGGLLVPRVEKRMFSKGYSTKTKGRPSGFGLYNVKKLVDAMGGDLSVEYVTGQYTEFMVTLPNGGE